MKLINCNLPKIRNVKNQLIIIASFLLLSNTLQAQRIIKEGIVFSSVTVTKDGNTISETQMETKFRDEQLKISIASPTTKNEIFIDRNSKRMTSVFEMMGKKIGFVIEDTSDVFIKRLAERITLIETDSVKTINGIDCRLSLLKYDPSLMIEDVKVWYDTKRKFYDKTMGVNVPGIEKINGIPILVLSAVQGMKMVYTLHKIDEVSKIDNTTFEIPSSYKITSPEEFQKTIQQLTTGGNN